MKDSRKGSFNNKKQQKKMNKNPIPPSKSARKAIEKNRRNQMKALYCKLCSLLPPQPSKAVVSMSDQLEEAAVYIKKLQEKLELMKQKRDMLKVPKPANLSSTFSSPGGLKLEVHVTGSTLNIVLVTGMFRHQHLFKETVRILIEEGADVASAGFSVVDRTVFHTIYSQIGVETEAARISERLRMFVANEY